jgi:hypothetical protein
VLCRGLVRQGRTLQAERGDTSRGVIARSMLLRRSDLPQSKIVSNYRRSPRPLRGLAMTDNEVLVMPRFGAPGAHPTRSSSRLRVSKTFSFLLRAQPTRPFSRLRVRWTRFQPENRLKWERSNKKEGLPCSILRIEDSTH